MEDSNSSEDNTLVGWTKDEKFQLLEALKEVGSKDIAQIISYIPSKNPHEIVTAINYYKTISVTKSAPAANKEQKTNRPPIIPLVSWAKYISDNYGFEEMQTETATALRLIAEFEDRPLPVCTEGIDFKKIYHILADALDGKSLPEDKMNKKIIDKCAVETALTSKAFMRNALFKQVISSVDMTNTEFELKKVTTNKELVNLRHLATQKSYNPLSIPEKYLKSSQKTDS